MEWFLLYTRPGGEAHAYNDLIRQGFKCCLPALNDKKQCATFSDEAIQPLFPRYIFVGLNLGEWASCSDRVQVLKGIGQMVMCGAGPAQVDARWIDFFRGLRTDRPGCGPRQFMASHLVDESDAPWVWLDAVRQLSPTAHREAETAKAHRG